MDGAPRPEARLVTAPGGGLVAGGPGWFVVNAAEAQWWHAPEFGDSCRFESTVEGARFRDYGLNLTVLEPGRPNCRYHGETGQEGFLVLAGECLAVVEGQELLLGPWDFVHCPDGTKHIFVGAGDAPCPIAMTGARPAEGSILYPVDPVAARHGACAASETADPKVAYAGRLPRFEIPPRVDLLPRWTIPAARAAAPPMGSGGPPGASR